MPHVKSSLLMTTAESELVRSLVLVSVQAYLSAHPPIMMPKISRVLYINRLGQMTKRGCALSFWFAKILDQKKVILSTHNLSDFLKEFCIFGILMCDIHKKILLYLFEQFHFCPLLEANHS